MTDEAVAGGNTLPSTPDPATITQVAGIVRTIIAGLGAMGLLGGSLAALTDAQISAIVTAFLTVGGVLMWIGAGVWSWWQKRQAQQHAHESAVASAIASSQATAASGTPTAIAVQPAKAPV